LSTLAAVDSSEILPFDLQTLWHKCLSANTTSADEAVKQTQQQHTHGETVRKNVDTLDNQLTNGRKYASLSQKK